MFGKKNLEKEIKKAEEKQQKLLVLQRNQLMELQKKRLRQKGIEEAKRLKQEEKAKKKKKTEFKPRGQVIRGLGFNEMRTYLNAFPHLQDNEFKPREAKETVDLHLDNMDTVTYVNPKGYPEKEITWEEPRDIQSYWLHQMPKLWLIVFCIFLFFGSIYFTYMWYI